MATSTKSKIKTTAKKAGETVKQKAKDAANAAKENPIGALKVVGVLVGVYLLYKVVKKVSDGIDNIGGGDSNIDDNIGGTGGEIINPTISEQQAINFASQLLDAFNAKEPIYGTDEATVELVFDQLKNASDFLLVFYAFGEKDYNGNNSPPTGWWSYLDSYEKRDLVYWLNSEIDPVKDAQLRQKVKSRVTSAGFVFP